MCAAALRRHAGPGVAGRALSPFSWPFHHFPWRISGQMPYLLTSTGERARKVVKGPAGDAAGAVGPPGGRASGRGTSGRPASTWSEGRTAGATLADYPVRTTLARVNAVIVAKGLAAGHGVRVLFSGLDLTVAPGDVVGLVGANGAGKSTLLKMLAGIEPPAEGAVSVSPPAATVGYLPQEPDRRPGETVREFLARRTGVAAAAAAMEAAADALAAGERGADDTYAAALDRWLALGGADLDERAEAVVSGLGLTASLDAAMTSLSGGQAARASLASLLLRRYDVVLLDEPTNDLDLDGLARLEEVVAGLRA